jgi:aspartyl-tRNA(Asn)/glutamyl-tRNA(Gln) amidotransferase subunit A
LETRDPEVSALDAYKLGISEASRLMREGVLTPSELLESHLRRIDALESEVRAWVTVDREGAREVAKRLSMDVEKGHIRGPLHGVPVGVKDIYNTAGLRTTMGSKIYDQFVPGVDADMVARLRQVGAIILGKTETTEFALTDPTHTRNPWNLEHTPGGSSSGSAAAVSSGMCPTALGSQTGGSVIRPASFCGVVGMKPTYDLISRRGVYPLSWSLDHVGFFTRSVEDADMVLGALVGDGRLPPPEVSKPPRIGVLRGFFEENADPEVWEGFMRANGVLQDAGVEVSETPLPSSFHMVHDAHRLIMASEAASVHEENFRKRARDYRLNIRGLVASGLMIPAHAYLRAQRIRARFSEEALHATDEVDCLMTPSAPTPALHGLSSTGNSAFNVPWSLCGFPVMTLPSGVTHDNLPLGIQIIGRPYEEHRLLSIALWCERALDFPKEPADPL